MNEHKKSNIVLPSIEARDFLIEVIEKMNYPGKMIEFVFDIKKQIELAFIRDVSYNIDDETI